MIEQFTTNCRELLREALTWARCVHFRMRRACVFGLAMPVFLAGHASTQEMIEFNGPGTVVPGPGYIGDRYTPFSATAHNPLPTMAGTWSRGMPGHGEVLPFDIPGPSGAVIRESTQTYDPTANRSFDLVETIFAGTIWNTVTDDDKRLEGGSVGPVWLVDQTSSPFPETLIAFGDGALRAQEEVALSVTITPELMSFLNPLAGTSPVEEPIFRIVPLGKIWGRYDNAQSMEPFGFPSSFEKDGVFQGNFTFHRPGAYELRLQTRRGTILASRRIDIGLALPSDLLRDAPDPVPLGTGWWPEIVLPDGMAMTLDKATPIELHWRKIDPDAPDLDLGRLAPEIQLYSALDVPDRCVASTKDMLGGPVWQVLPEAGADGVLRGEIPGDFSPVEVLWAVVKVNGDLDAVNSWANPLTGTPRRLEVLPPAWNGKIDIRFAPRDQAPAWQNKLYDYTITVSGVEASDYADPPYLELLTRPATSLGGLSQSGEDDLEIEYYAENEWDRENGILVYRFSVHAAQLARGFDVVLKHPNHSYYDSGQPVLARVPLPPPSGFAPDDWHGAIRYNEPDKHAGLLFPGGPYNELVLCGESVEAPAQSPMVGVSINAPDGAMTAGHLAQIEVTATNSGAADLVDGVLAVDLGQRHPAEIEYDAPQAPLAAILPVSDAQCEVRQPGRTLICERLRIAPGAALTVGLHVAMPESGHILEVAAQIEEAKATAQFVAEAPPAGEGLPDGPTEIYKLITINPQTGRDGLGDLFTRYPFGSDPRISASDSSRMLMVLGKQLPDRLSETEIRSGDRAVSYHFIASDQTHDRRELVYADGGLVGKGLARLFGSNDDLPMLLEEIEQGGLEFILVEANFSQGVLPGMKTFEVNGARGEWVLDFADLSLDLSFMRLGEHDPEYDDVAVEDILAEGYFGEAVHLVAKIRPVEIDLPSIPALVMLPEGPSSASPVEITLTRRDLPDGPAYVSPPLYLGNIPPSKSGTSLFPSIDGQRHTHLRAAIDGSYAVAFLPRALGVETTLELRETPARGGDGTPFRAAFQIAATCRGISVGDDAWRSTSYREIETFSNRMILNGFQRLGQNMHLGHHAGLILLRDAWMEAAAAQERRLGQALSDPDTLRRSFLAWRAMFDNPLLPDPVSPLFKMRVSAFAGKADETITFDRAVRFGPQIRETAQKSGAGDTAELDWAEAVTRAAMLKLRDASRKARVDVSEVDPCDAGELLELGKGLGVLAQIVSPRLVMPDSKSGGWLPDQQARRWIASAINLADIYAEQRDAVSAENDFFLAALSVAMFPLGAIEGATVGWIAIGASAAEFSSQLVFESHEYYQSRQELARALGVSLLIGDARYNRARAKEKTLRSMLVNTAFSALSLGIDARGFVHARRALRGADLAKSIDSLGAIAALQDAQKADFDAFLDDLLLKRAGGGADRLTSEQRRIFDLLYGSNLPGKPLLRPLANAAVPEVVRRPSDGPSGIMHSPEEIAAIQSAGRSPDGVRRFIPAYRDVGAPVRALAEGGGEAEQLVLDAATDVFERMTRRYAPGSVEHMIARQNLMAMQDGKAMFVFDDSLDNVGEGLADIARRRYVLTFNLETIADQVVRGVRWQFTALFAHEAGHMFQFFHESYDAVRIGRALREYDSMMRMAVVQRMAEELAGVPVSLSSRTALEMAFDYALEIQWKAYDFHAPLSPKFPDPANYVDGLMQLTHSEAVARGRLFFPELSELEVLEIYLASQQRAYLSYAAAAYANPLARAVQIEPRFNAMIAAARARIAALTP